MIAPRLSVSDAKGVVYPITQLGEAWVINYAGGFYFLTTGNDPTLQARRFLQNLPKNPNYPRRPAWIASPNHPLLLDVDGVIVRAWPTMVNRDNPPRTYQHPYWNHRVTALKEAPVWMFTARGRERSPGGEARGEHTVADVAALARLWLQRIDDVYTE